MQGWIVLGSLRLLSCAIEKNALTLQSALAHVALGKRPGRNFYWNTRKIPKRNIVEKLNDDGWRGSLVWREPVERFLSAYNSKCGLKDEDGRLNCHDWFGFSSYKRAPTLREVVDALRRRRAAGEHACTWNPHWAPQHCFCGLEDFRLASSITHVVPFHDVNRGLESFYEGRVSDRTAKELRRQIQNATAVPLNKIRRHRTHTDSSAIRHQLEPWMLNEIRRLYEADFTLLRKLNQSVPAYRAASDSVGGSVQAPSLAPLPPLGPRYKRKRKHFIAVSVLIHNEADIIVEFVKHHLDQGIDHVYIVDDESTDNFETRLKACNVNPARYSISQRSFGPNKKYKDQISVLNSMVSLLRREATWGVLLDADEFLVPRANPERTVHALLSAAPLSTCDAVAIPWLIFSRGNVTHEPIGNVRFTYRWRWGLDKQFARKGFAMRKFRNRVGDIETKTLFQTDAVSRSDIHGVQFNKGFTGLVCTPTGTFLAQRTPSVLNVSESAVRTMPFAVHHYRFRSLDGVTKKADEKFARHYGMARKAEISKEEAATRVDGLTNRLDVHDPFMSRNLGVRFEYGTCAARPDLPLPMDLPS